MIGTQRSATRAGTALMLVALVAACSHLPSIRWPWQHPPTPPPQEVHELIMTGAAGTSAKFPQYWKRNTLVIDMRTATGSGSLVLKPREGFSWPVRLAFRVTPGSIAVLEVRGDQRTLLPITAEGAKPVDLELDPGVYRRETAQIEVVWGPAQSASAD